MRARYPSPLYTTLQRYFSSANAALTGIFNEDEVARKSDKPIDESVERKLRKATLWMQRQDAAAYVLLGDPAVRLNIDRARSGTQLSAPIPSAVDLATPPAALAASMSGVKKLDDIRKMERAVMKVVLDDAEPAKIAERLDVEPEDVRAWVKAYQDAGRAALQKL